MWFIFSMKKKPFRQFSHCLSSLGKNSSKKILVFKLRRTVSSFWIQQCRLVWKADSLLKKTETYSGERHPSSLSQCSVLQQRIIDCEYSSWDRVKKLLPSNRCWDKPRLILCLWFERGHFSENKEENGHFPANKAASCGFHFFHGKNMLHSGNSNKPNESFFQLLHFNNSPLSSGLPSRLSSSATCLPPPSFLSSSLFPDTLQ